MLKKCHSERKARGISIDISRPSALIWVVLIGLHSHVYADEPLHIGVILDDSISMLEKTLHRTGGTGGNGSSVEAVKKIDILKEQMSAWIQSRLEKEDSIYLSGLIPRQMRDKEIHITEGMRYWDSDSRFVPYPPESIGKTAVVREYSRDAIAGILETQMRLISFPSELPAAMKEMDPYMDITPLGYSLYEVSRWLNGYLPKDKKPSLRLLAVTDGIDYFGAENTCENIRRIEQEKLLSKQQISLHLIYFLPSQADRMDDQDAPTKALLDEANRIEKNYLTTVLACTKEMRDWVRVDAVDEPSALKEAVDSEIFKITTDSTETEESADEKGDSDPKNNIIEIYDEDIKEMEKIIDRKELSKDEFEKEIQDLDLKPIAGSTLNYLKNQNLFFTIAPDEETIEPDKEKELIFFSLRDSGTNNFSLLTRATVNIPSLKYKWKDEYGRIITWYQYTIFNDTPYLTFKARDSDDTEKSIWINLVSFTRSDEKDLKLDDKVTYAHILPQSNDLALLVRPNSLDEPWYYLQVPAGSYSYSKTIYSHGSESYRELEIDERAEVSVLELPPVPEEFRESVPNIYNEPKFEFSGPATYDFFDWQLAGHIALDLNTKKWIKKNTFERVLAHFKSLNITLQIVSSNFMDSNETSSIKLTLQDDDKLFQGLLIQFDKTKRSSDGFVKHEQFIDIDKLKEKRNPIQYQDYHAVELLFGFTPNILFILEKPTDSQTLSVSVYSRGLYRKTLIDYTPYFKMDAQDTKIKIAGFGALNDKLILDLEYRGEISRIVYDMIKNEVIEDDSEYQDVNLNELRSGSSASNASVEADFPDRNAGERAVSTTSSMKISHLNFHLNGGRRIETPERSILDRYFYDIVHYADLHSELSGKLDSDIYSLNEDEDIPFRMKDVTDFDIEMLSGEAIAFHFYRLNDEHLKTKPYLLLYFNDGGKSYYGFLKRTYVEKFIIGNKD